MVDASVLRAKSELIPRCAGCRRYRQHMERIGTWLAENLATLRETTDPDRRALAVVQAHDLSDLLSALASEGEGQRAGSHRAPSTRSETGQ